RGPILHLDLADGRLGPGLAHFGVGEAPEIAWIRRTGEVQGVIVPATSSLAKHADRLPRGADFDIGHDRARIDVKRVLTRSSGQILQPAEHVRRDKGPKLFA